MVNWTVELVRELIEDYEREAVLWNVKHPDYNNKFKTYEAYERLLVKYRKLEPTMEKDTLYKKIQGLRTCYRKEVRKIEKGEESGNPYTPGLWYYPNMKFLDLHGTPPARRYNPWGQWNPKQTKDSLIEDWEETHVSPSMKMECYEESTTSSLNHEENEYGLVTVAHSDTPEDQELEHDVEVVTEDKSSQEQRQDKRIPHRVHQKRHKRRRVVKVGSSLPNFNENSHYEQENVVIADIPTDNTSIFTSNVSAKLRLMEREQRIYTERLINEALFYGELGHLNIQSRIDVGCKIKSDTTSTSTPKNDTLIE